MTMERKAMSKKGHQIFGLEKRTPLYDSNNQPTPLNASISSVACVHGLYATASLLLPNFLARTVLRKLMRQ